MKQSNTSRSAFFYARTSIGLALILAGVSLALMSVGQFSAQAQQRIKPNFGPGLVPPLFDCSQIQAFGIDKQENLRAGAIQIYCGTARGGSLDNEEGASSIAQEILAPLSGTTDQDLIEPGPESGTHITQSETFVAANPDDPNTIVVAFNDSRGVNSNPINISGASVSTDGGNSYTRLTKTNGQSPFSNTFGDPVVLYQRSSGTWFTAWLDAGCGGQGIGGYKSTTPADPNSWTHYCAHTGSFDDRESGAVDNNPSSAHYGRMYISWNDFNAGSDLFVVFSDNGTTWTKKQISTSFVRDVQITVDRTTGTVFLAGMNEMNGGLTSRSNLIYRSTDGGNTWTNTYTGPSFTAPGRTTCPNTYFACMFGTSSSNGYWRHMGWGQPGANNGVVHYVYDARTATDPANSFYIRSTDNGVTFSAPFQLNTDSTTKAQWQPNISVGDDNSLLAVWYDERLATQTCVKGNTGIPCYQMWARRSTDGGVTWGADSALSDVVTPLPTQPDSSIITEYAGDYDYSLANNATHIHTWVDGRVAVSGQSQQDAFTDRDPAGVASDTVTITQASWNSLQMRLNVKATDSDPSATLTCTRTSDGFVFGTLRTRGDGNYVGKFRNVTTNPVNITITSDLGGSDSADVRVRP